VLTRRLIPSEQFGWLERESNVYVIQGEEDVVKAFECAIMCSIAIVHFHSPSLHIDLNNPMRTDYLNGHRGITFVVYIRVGE